MSRKTLLGMLAAAALVAPGLLGPAGAPAYAQTVDEIIAKNLQARGGADKIKGVTSARLTGKMTMGQGMEAPLALEWRRPNMLRLEFSLQGMTGVTAFDGTTAWMVMPFMGKKDPERMPDDEAKNFAEESDFFGPLVDYKEKGSQVELIGKESVEGTQAYKLKLTRKNGNVSYIFLDADAYLEIREESKRTMHGQELEVETSVGDYKEVGGILFPHSFESKPKGSPTGQVISFDQIQLNVDLPESKFKMPEVKPEEKKDEAAKPPQRSAR
jgi:outer membrane lipoprotein-sorting protein